MSLKTRNLSVIKLHAVLDMLFYQFWSHNHKSQNWSEFLQFNI